MHPLSAALPITFVPARVTNSALVAHRHSFSPPRSRTPHYCKDLVPLSVSLWNDLNDPVYHGVELTDFKSSTAHFYWPNLLFLSSSSIFSFSTLCGLVV